MFYINLHDRVKAFREGSTAHIGTQIAFASALALTALAKLVRDGEQQNEKDVLDRPRPFTTSAIGSTSATKAGQSALIFVKDITARYLEPYEFGGSNVLNGKALLKPIGARDSLDEFGNLPRTYLRSLIGVGGSVKDKQTGLLKPTSKASIRSDVFIGKVKTSKGVVDGVWQRTSSPTVGPARPATLTRVTKGGKIVTRKVAGYTPGREGRRLKLLVRFTDAHPIAEKNRLHWFEVAERIVDQNFEHEFQWAMARALATPK